MLRHAGPRGCVCPGGHEMTAIMVTLLLASHSGGTDANGCHTDSSTGVRHCHSRSGGSGSGSGDSGDSGQADLQIFVCLGVCGGITAVLTLLAGAALSAGLAVFSLALFRHQMVQRTRQQEMERPPPPEEEAWLRERPRRKHVPDRPSDEPTLDDKEHQQQLLDRCQEQGMSLEQCWKLVQ